MSEAKTQDDQANLDRITPLEERSCGDCVACCVSLRIETPEITKAANSQCQHCTAAGCGIYETRPPVCSGFLCGWRLSARLSDGWRPDRSGLILMEAKAPHGYASELALELVITEGEDSIRRPFFAPFVMANVAARRAIFLTIDDTRAVLNPYLEPLLPRGVDVVREQLLRFHAGATTHRHSRNLPP